jgi:hypothetical protein
MWGTGAVYFQNCELKAATAGGYYTQIRNGQGQGGYVFANSRLTSEPGVTGMYLARTRIDPTVFPYSQVVYLNCAMGAHVLPAGWLLNNFSVGPSVEFWEYGSTDLNGVALNVSQRAPFSRQLTAQELAQWLDPAPLLGGWVPYTVNAASATALGGGPIVANWSAAAAFGEGLDRAVSCERPAGSWYPGDQGELRRLVEAALESSRARTGPELLPGPIAFVVPHAGLMYSGTVACAAYLYLQAWRPKRVVLLGFSHRGGPAGVAIPNVDAFATPLGETRVDMRLSGSCARTRSSAWPTRTASAIIPWKSSFRCYSIRRRTRSWCRSTWDRCWSPSSTRRRACWPSWRIQIRYSSPAPT